MSKSKIVGEIFENAVTKFWYYFPFLFSFFQAAKQFKAPETWALINDRRA